MERKKILFIQNKLLDYRIPLYEYIQREVGEVTICHAGTSNRNIKGVKEIILDHFTIKGFVFLRGLNKVVKEHDIIVGMFDLRWVSIWSLMFNISRAFKFFLWGIGVSTENGFGRKSKLDSFRAFLARRSDGVVFYSSFPKDIYEKFGVPANKIFIANNTVFCPRKIELANRRFEKFLFIGSLTKRKQIKTLIDQFIRFREKTPTNIYLEIIGDGPEKQDLEEYINSCGMSSSISMLGHVDDSLGKELLFSNAIASISIGQAGLSVLESFSYGVPFITKDNSITGGERLNILNGWNGVLLKDEDLLCDVMIELVANEDLCWTLSKNSFDFYWQNRTIDKMAGGFIEAFNTK